MSLTNRLKQWYQKVTGPKAPPPTAEETAATTAVPIVQTGPSTWKAGENITLHVQTLPPDDGKKLKTGFTSFHLPPTRVVTPISIAGSVRYIDVVSPDPTDFIMMEVVHAEAAPKTEVVGETEWEV